ncbi:MAG: ParA family protein [Thiothrix sp.]|uniref:ParA family protein n=1 Tax=Thiothrix sp. TaxID=1032 RepID=UPI002639BC8F|nr:ParA family protein [Thiothrix sp.]MDD5392644.1 ParA family protein [Thiothrix sp.]
MSSDSERKPTIITICSTKGGVGKTTLTANLGGFLASLNKRVLLVDADVQPALSSYYELAQQADCGLERLLIGGDLTNTISATSAGCDLIYSDDPEGKLQDWVLHTPDGRTRLKYLLNQLKANYDFILIDTQGAVGPLQDAAVIAADLLLSPIPTETMSAREFARGTLGMLGRLQPMTYYTTLTLAPLYGVLYRVDRTKDAANVALEVREELGGGGSGITIMDAVIPSAVAWREAATQQVPVHTLTKHPMAKLSLMAVIAELGILPVAQGGGNHA